MITWTLNDAEQTIEFGRVLGQQLRAGDVLILDGPLGAGKTTLTKGIARGLGITDAITSPTFVIAHVHRGADATLVHVDAYRLGSELEFDDLDLDADVDRAVTVVEWGEDRARGLAAQPMFVRIAPQGDGDDRQVTLHGLGARNVEVIKSLQDWTP